jgi:DNA topoisomerase-1
VRQPDAPSLDYSSDAAPGIVREIGDGVPVYRAASGRRIAGARTLARIAALVIPPAWTDVWICPNPRGHLQATGKDARGRKQYRYHPR